MNKKLVKKSRNFKIVKRLRKKKSKKIKLLIKRIFILFSCFSIIAVLFFAINLLLNNFFSVHSITIEGNTKYDNSEIINCSEINNGSSLIFVNTYKAEEKIYKSLSYVDGVSVKKELPDKIKIIVDTANPAYSLCVENEYLIVSEKDKLLEKRAELPPEIINIIGAKISVSEIGKIVYENENLKGMFTNIANTFKNNGLNNIKEINVSDLENIAINYDNRVKIEIGGSENLDYKILTAKEIIMNKIGPSEKGTLDLKNITKENRSYFTPEG